MFPFLTLAEAVSSLWFAKGAPVYVSFLSSEETFSQLSSVGVLVILGSLIISRKVRVLQSIWLFSLFAFCSFLQAELRESRRRLLF